MVSRRHSSRGVSVASLVRGWYTAFCKSLLVSFISRKLPTINRKLPALNRKLSLPDIFNVSPSTSDYGGWLAAESMFKFYRIVDNYYYQQVSLKQGSGDERSRRHSDQVSTPPSQHRKDSTTSSPPGLISLLDDDDTLKRLGGAPYGRQSSGGGVLPDLLPPQTPPRSGQGRGQPGQQDKSTSDEYRQAVSKPAMHKNASSRSFQAFGFSANNRQQPGSNQGTLESPAAQAAAAQRRGSQINVNVTPTIIDNDTPEIRKYKKRFNSDILCAALWGVNLLIGTDNGLMLLDRSGQGKVYQLISRRKFQQMEVLEGQNILITISGKKNKIRVYYLSWLKTKIFKVEQNDKRNGWMNVGEMENCVHFKIVKYERIKFLVIAMRDSIEIYAWAPKPYHKFMAFKSFSNLVERPQLVDLTVEEGQRLKVVYGSSRGFHAIDLDTSAVFDIYIPAHTQETICPHTICILPNTNGMQLLLCYDNEGVYVDTFGKISKNCVLQWGELPTSVAFISTGQIMGWGHKAIEIRSAETGHLDGVFMHKKAQKLKFLCERNDKVFFSSIRSGSSCQIYFMTLNKPGLINWF